MKKEKVFFNPIDGSGPLTISWSAGPKGDAVEAKRGNGVGFFSEEGNLLCVIFDEVEKDNDHQQLVFNHCSIEIRIKNGRVTVSKNPSFSLRGSQRTSKQRRTRVKKKASSV